MNRLGLGCASTKLKRLTDGLLDWKSEIDDDFEEWSPVRYRMMLVVQALENLRLAYLQVGGESIPKKWFPPITEQGFCKR